MLINVYIQLIYIKNIKPHSEFQGFVSLHHECESDTHSAAFVWINPPPSMGV